MGCSRENRTDGRPDLCASLADIYGWGREPSGFQTGLVVRCERLAITPLRQFQPGDLRVMLGQQFAPEILVPMALDLLEANPLLDAELFEGDLLSMVLHQELAVWRDRPDLLFRVRQMLDHTPLEEALQHVQTAISDFYARIASLG